MLHRRLVECDNLAGKIESARIESGILGNQVAGKDAPPQSKTTLALWIRQ
jgi:hypothetical protein